jgi:hypothetical protein
VSPAKGKQTGAPSRGGTRPKAAASKPAAARAPLAGYSGRPLLDKLGVKPGTKVAALGLDDQKGFLAELRERVGEPSTTRAPRGADLVVMRVDSPRELAKLASLERTIARNGAIWVVWPKGQPHIKEDMVRGAALSSGLVDVKVCAFSDLLSALKLVIPVARR